MKKLHLAFLWHHHQPVYQDPLFGRYELPWVRLHATKDYYDTVAILDEFPAIKATFNLVPSLLVQLKDYARGTAHDRFLDLSEKPADQLTDDDRVFILHNFFMANRETMIEPYARYRYLLEKRGRQSSPETLQRTHRNFSATELRDLQVWFNLAWMDPYWRTHLPVVKRLYTQGSNFSETDKQELLAAQRTICGMIVEKYRQAQERGQIEISVSPFFHPILPLLCDTDIAHVALPQIQLPSRPFRHPEDAAAQIATAVTYYEHAFGRRPAGMWPSEGSVSDDAVRLMATAGLRWIASDQEILFRSQPLSGSNRLPLYHPYRVEIPGAPALHMVFRDHTLSDAIGFMYAQWQPADAVADFMHRLHVLRTNLADDAEDALVTIILDGENCWEYYAHDGWDFLRLLYQALSTDPGIETVTLDTYCADHPATRTLRSLWPGSWINANYGIWIGHQEDNLAWHYLAETRDSLVNFIRRFPEKKESAAVARAWEYLYRAEGSDWNWWYGDDHASESDDVFDTLFRHNLIAVYQSIDTKPPEYLHKAISRLIRNLPTLEPIDFIAPVIDGLVTDYYEWQAAGLFEVRHAGGSMHQAESIVNSFHFGFNMKELFFRINLNIPLNNPGIEEFTLKIIFLIPDGREAAITLKPEGGIDQCVLRTPAEPTPLPQAAAVKVIELAIPWEKMNIPPEVTVLEFVVAVTNNSREIERWPHQSSVTLQKPTPEFGMHAWSV
jgi:alpha-amylase/alpha-mannosidase (GH57 family)